MTGESHTCSQEARAALFEQKARKGRHALPAVALACHKVQDGALQELLPLLLARVESGKITTAFPREMNPVKSMCQESLMCYFNDSPLTSVLSQLLGPMVAGFLLIPPVERSQRDRNPVKGSKRNLPKALKGDKTTFGGCNI